jgi:hypothetical protein
MLTALPTEIVRYLLVERIKKGKEKRISVQVVFS